MSNEIAPIEMDWVEGHDETTVWLWTDSPDPVTVRFTREEWERIEQAADGNVERFITEKVVSDLEASGYCLSG